MTFGRHLLEEWLLDPAITYLNHPTVGATPRRVLAADIGAAADTDLLAFTAAHASKPPPPDALHTRGEDVCSIRCEDGRRAEAGRNYGQFRSRRQVPQGKPVIECRNGQSTIPAEVQVLSAAADFASRVHSAKASGVRKFQAADPPVMGDRSDAAVIRAELHVIAGAG